MLQVRAEVGQHGGVAVIVKAMKTWASSGGVQCNGCLAIVSLVRAESEVCEVRPPCGQFCLPTCAAFQAHQGWGAPVMAASTPALHCITECSRSGHQEDYVCAQRSQVLNA